VRFFGDGRRRPADLHAKIDRKRCEGGGRLKSAWPANCPGTGAARKAEREGLEKFISSEKKKKREKKKFGALAPPPPPPCLGGGDRAEAAGGSREARENLVDRGGKIPIGGSGLHPGQLFRAQSSAKCVSNHSRRVWTTKPRPGGGRREAADSATTSAMVKSVSLARRRRPGPF